MPEQTENLQELRENLNLPPGCRMRPVEETDLQLLVDFINLCAQVEYGEDETNADDLLQDWYSPGFSLGSDTRLVESATGEVSGYVEVWDQRDPPVKPYLWSRTHPERHGQGIGTALLAWGEARARQVLARAPQGVQVVVQTGVVAGYQPSIDLLRANGYRLVRYFNNLEIQLEGKTFIPRWPHGIELRPYQHPQQAEPIFRAFQEAFADHWGVVAETFESAFPRWQHHRFDQPEFDPGLWFVAWDDDQIAGFSLCEKHKPADPDCGWVAQLGVRPAWRRQGLGLALLEQSFAALQAMGKPRAGLNVDSDSPTGANRLYEKAGMHLTKQWTIWEKILRPGVDLAARLTDI